MDLPNIDINCIKCGKLYNLKYIYYVCNKCINRNVEFYLKFSIFILIVIFIIIDIFYRTYILY